MRTPRDLGTDLPCKGIFITRNLPPSIILLRMPCREAGGKRGSKMAQTPVSRMDQRMSFFSWLWSSCGGLNFGHTTYGSTYISSLPETSIIHPSPNSISQSISSHITNITVHRATSTLLCCHHAGFSSSFSRHPSPQSWRFVLAMDQGATAKDPHQSGTTDFFTPSWTPY